jgi:pantoate kinase
MVNTAARNAMHSVLQDPRLESFLAASRNFGNAAGFQTPNVARLISTMISLGSVGAAQNMIGEAVHGVVECSNSKRVVNAVKMVFPAAKVFATRLDDRGVRLLEPKPKH